MTAKQLINKPEPVQQKSTSTGALAQSAGTEGGGLVQLEEEMALEKQQPSVLLRITNKEMEAGSSQRYIVGGQQAQIASRVQTGPEENIFHIKAFEITQRNRMSKEIMQPSFLEVFNT